MLSTLSSQLHFVRDIQKVETNGVAPLQAIRDETSKGAREQTIGIEQLRETLDNEDVIGHARRPRRRRTSLVNPEVESWQVLANASETSGPYFVVRSASTEPAQATEKVDMLEKKSIKA